MPTPSATGGLRLAGRVIRAVLAVLVASAAVLALGQPAYAATVPVDTADDVVNGADGVTSLREAIADANAAAAATTIELVAGETYQLDLCGGAAEDANASGDLDYIAADALTIDGDGAVIEQTCDDERVLHNTDTTATVTLNGVTLTGGQGIGAAVLFAGDLVLVGVTATGNNAGANSVLEGESVMPGPSLVLTDSTVAANTGDGVHLSFGSVTITDSSVSDNTLGGVDLTDGHLTISGSLFANNGGNGVRTTGQGSGLLTFADSISRDNDGTGLLCGSCGDVQVTNSAIHGNDDGGIEVAMDLDDDADSITTVVEQSSVYDNAKTGHGGAIEVTAPDFEAGTGQVVVDRSTLSGNTVSGAMGSGGAIYAERGIVEVNNSTITGNTASVAGGAVFTELDDVHLRHATIVENAAPAGANVASGTDLHAFGSVVAAAGGGDDCEIAGAVTSTGYNLAGDASCGFTGTGDTNGAGAPGLGPLQDNGGPTLTRAPLAGSPTLGKVPAAACTVLTIDQRGTARPQGAACEAGAVEVALDGGGSGLPPTGVSVTWIVVAGLGLLGLGLALLLLLLLVRRRPS